MHYAKWKYGEVAKVLVNANCSPKCSCHIEIGVAKSNSGVRI